MITVEEIEKDYRENIERAMEQLGHEMQDYPSNYGEAAYNVAIEVMEKQIPQKPVFTHGNHNNDWECPKCGRRYGNYGYYDYCPKCGQKILWEAEE